MKKENLLSIGALSKQTGVHIKSLRYYDSLGILRPAYVDPSSGYRYYSLQQIPVVDAIQLCVDLDISLKHFTDYYMDGSSRIHYGKLIERGTILAQEKIQAIQERLVKLDKMRSEIERSELIQKSDAMVRCSFPTMNLLLAPYPENDTEMKVLALFHNLVQTAESSGLTINYFSGRLLHCQGSQRDLSFYIGVDIPEGVQDLPENLLRLPAGKYLCCKQAAPAIENALDIFSEQFALDYEKYVIESELSPGDYDCAAPPFELRCSLPNSLMERKYSITGPQGQRIHNQRPEL